MRIASWNVNSIKARLPNVVRWLEEEKPDIACLQELKCVDEAFPRSEIESLGYNIETHGQKTYNGVALLSRLPLEDVSRGLPILKMNKPAILRRWFLPNKAPCALLRYICPMAIRLKAARAQNIAISWIGWRRWKNTPKLY